MAYSTSRGAGNIVQGMGAGAAAGTMAMPGWGTLAGGLLGLAGGIFQTISEADSEDERREYLQNIADALGTSYDTVIKQYNDWVADMGESMDIDNSVKMYKSGRDAIDNMSYKDYDWLDTNRDGVISDDEKAAAQFSYDKSVEDFMNPYLEDLYDDATRKIEQSAAGAGVGRGTGAARAIAKSIEDIKYNAYQQAQQQYNSERDFAYKTWSDYNQAMRDRLGNLMNFNQWKTGQQMQIGQDAINWQSDVFANKQNMELDRAKTKAQIEASI